MRPGIEEVMELSFDGVKGKHRYTYRVFGPGWAPDDAEELDVVTQTLDDNAAFAQAKMEAVELYGEDVILTLIEVF